MTKGLLYSLSFLTFSHSRTLQQRNSRHELGRHCYRSTHFSQPGCPLLPHDNNTCSTLPHYDCNSFYLGLLGRHPDEHQRLTSICNPRDTPIRLFDLQTFKNDNDGQTIPCEFQYVCHRDHHHIPSSHWEAELLPEGRQSCMELLGTCRPVRRKTGVLARKGCDQHVGQYRYQAIPVEQIVSYVCIRVQGVVE